MSEASVAASQTITAPWLFEPSLQTLLAALHEDGETARVVGGAVRNALMGLAVNDVDVATTTRPDETIRRVEAAGFKARPTGIEHGTVTVVTPAGPYEVTTLREDVETDGRHAKVVFGRDFEADARRRDFTINALYAEPDGRVVDLVGGLADIRTRTLRFVGDAATRIAEDHLRSLRFFRFFAWYGTGRPDADGIRAATRLKDGLNTLSAERVWSEMRKLLAAPDPSRALLWMRQTGVLTKVLPETERWGIDAVHPLMEAERAYEWPADPLLRLAAIVPPDAARLTAMARRLRMANAERDRLVAFAHDEPVPAIESDAGLRWRLYFGERTAVLDRLKLGIATGRQKAGDDPMQLALLAQLLRHLETAERFDPPPFPLSGEDLKAAGVEPGREIGRVLTRLKEAWVDSGFVLSRETLLEKV